MFTEMRDTWTIVQEPLQTAQDADLCKNIYSKDRIYVTFRKYSINAGRE